jgi:hypothetical protein
MHPKDQKRQTITKLSSNSIVSNFTLIKEDLLVGAEAVGNET